MLHMIISAVIIYMYMDDLQHWIFVSILVD